MSPRKSSADRGKRLAQALEQFEKGLKALGKKDYAKARSSFTEVIESHSGEIDVVARARMYLVVCERATEKRAAFKPKTAADFVAWGVFLHNQGDYAEAIKQFHKASESEPKNDHALYCLAASSSRAGDTPAALDALRSAIAVSPESRAQARTDSDFDPLRGEDGFLDLIYG